METNKNQVGRREFIATSTLAVAGLALSQSLFASQKSSPFDGTNQSGPLAEKRKLGTLEVTSLGLGCMSMAGVYNAAQPKAEMVKVIRAAYDKGVTFFDTAEVYGPFLSEEIVGEALSPFRDKVVIASKFGFDLLNGGRGGKNSRPEHIKLAVEGMLKRLKTVEDVAGAVKQLIGEGKIKHFGLSEVSPATIRKAHAIQTVTALQSEYSILERVVEAEILPLCEELGMGFVPWGPVARGFLTGRYDENSTFDPAYRHTGVPYFTKEALKNNMPLLEVVKTWATKKGITPAQFSLAWLIAQKPFIVPIPGTTNPKHLAENIGAMDVRLTSGELTEIRTEISKINLVGVRKQDSVHKDQ